MKKIFLILLCTPVLIFAQPEYNKFSAMPGDFSRFGFGARGIGMGNAMSAVTEGNLVSYYNPALSAFQQNNSFQTSYSFLSLDRSLNYLNFTRRFDFYSKNDTSQNRKPRSSAGVSIGIINAGVGKIIGTDNNGNKTEELSVSENQFFLGLSNRFSEKFSLGVAVKYYYFKLYEEVSASGVGLDIGALYLINKNFSASLMLTDINSKYRWDTGVIYGQEGSVTEDKFPLLRKAGISYRNNELGLTAAAELENSNAGTNFLRAGAEYNLIENLYIRGGIDQLNLGSGEFPVRPAFGFSYSHKIGNWKAGIDYAFMMEENSPHDRHIIGINIIF